MNKQKKKSDFSWGALIILIPFLTLFFLLNSYTTGLSPSVMGYLLNSLLVPKCCAFSATSLKKKTFPRKCLRNCLTRTLLRMYLWWGIPTKLY